MNITLIHNPKAGNQQPSKEKLLEVLGGKEVEIKYISAKDESFAEILLLNIGDVIIVAGGDGTVRRIARLLLGKHVPIAVMPLGTANNISKSLDQAIPVAISKAGWGDLETMSFDVGFVKFTGGKEYFVESIGCGAVAEMMYQFGKEKKNKQPEFNHPQDEIKYARSMMKDILQHYQACHYDITIDGHAYSGKYLLVEVMNIKSIGPNLRLALQADPGDGWLDVVLIQEHEKDAMMAYLSMLQHGKEDNPDFTVERGRKISITTTCNRFHVDDELLPGKWETFGDTVHLDIQLENDCLSMFKHVFKYHQY